MKWRQYIPNHAVTTDLILVLVIVALIFLMRDDSMEDRIELGTSEIAAYDRSHSLDDETLLNVDRELNKLALDDASRDQHIRDLLEQKSYKRARTLLLEVAGDSVMQDDQERLSNTMLLLGEVSIHQQELGAAEIYLQEALYLTMSRNDLVGTASSYQLLGQLNIRARELARRASNTYDDLWQARSLTSRGLYQGVSESLNKVITDNVEIRRYGAAADAWEAMAALHDRQHDNYQAQQARIEAARLFASTGRMTHVRRLLGSLDRQSISDTEMADINAEINDLFESHQEDLIQTSQARDYQMLYFHYLRKGETERAWEFRVKASETLAGTSDRSVFQRQADVIAVLYNSNFAMERARQYLDKAGAIYNDKGAFEGLEQTRQMESLIY
jgi:hypothetical protein